jgi:hypothetical protein
VCAVRLRIGHALCCTIFAQATSEADMPQHPPHPRPDDPMPMPPRPDPDPPPVPDDEPGSDPDKRPGKMSSAA